MGTIKTYEADTKGLTAPESGTAALASAAANTLSTGFHIDAQYNKAGDEISGGIKAAGQAASNVYDKMVVQPEISKGASALAGWQSDMTRQYNESIMKAGPNGAEKAVDDFNKNVLEPNLQKWQSGFQTDRGQKWAEDQANAFRQHMMEKGNADIATRNGQAIVQNITDQTNQWSNMVRQDPSSLDHVLATSDSAVNAVASNSGMLTPATAGQIGTRIAADAKATIVKSAILGAAEKDTDLARRMIDSGKYDKYIDGNDMRRMVDQMDRIDKSDKVAAEKDARQQRFEASAKVVAEDYLPNMVSDDPNVQKPTLKQIATDQRLTPQDRTMLSQAWRASREPTAAVTSRQTSVELFRRITAPASDPNRITDTQPIDQAFGDGKLTNTDYTFLRNQITQNKGPTGDLLKEDIGHFLTGVRPQIDHSNPLQEGKEDPSGIQNFYRYRMALMAKIEDYQKAGKDPRDLLNPAKPDYFGKPEQVNPYTVSLSSSMTNIANKGKAMPDSSGANLTPEELKATSGNLTDPNTRITNVETIPLNSPTEQAVKQKYPDAELRGDGNYWVLRNGKAYKINPDKLTTPTAPISR